MIFHENRLLAYFFQKLRKMLQNLSSAAVVIGALRVNCSVSTKWNMLALIGQISASLTLNLPKLSADNFCKQFGPMSGSTKCRA